MNDKTSAVNLPNRPPPLFAKPGHAGILIFGFWTIIALFNTSQNLVCWMIEDKNLQLQRVLAWSMTGWLIWALLTPLVFRLSRRLPLERPRLKQGLVKHLGFSILASICELCIEVVAIHLILKLFAMPFLSLTEFVDLLTYKLHVNILIYWAILGAAQALEFYNKYRERQVLAAQFELKAARLSSQLTEARLQALKLQLQPHFLFNTHHAIIGLMLKNNPETAIKMITRLSDLLRMTLDSANDQIVTLRRELEFLDLYLEIQKMRFNDRLRIEMNIAPEALDAQLPYLLLQPLVENAIQHGIAPYSRTGLIEIKAANCADWLELAVRDDGPGNSNGARRPLREGIGIENTRERLRQLYGDSHEIRLSNGKDGGFQATIKIPFQTIETHNFDHPREERRL